MYLFLFSLAFIGFIICLIKAIKNKKHNIPAKKYAIITVALFVLAAVFSNMNDKKKTDSEDASADTVAVVKTASVKNNINTENGKSELRTTEEEFTEPIISTTEEKTTERHELDYIVNTNTGKFICRIVKA